ncbi:MAG: hypothetical protein QW275_02595, partial [Candidatus Anstonellaceae archaeon]
QSYFKIYLHPPENALEYDFSQAEVAGRAIIYDGKTISNPHGSYFQFYIQRKTLIAQGLFIEHAEMAPIAITYASHITRADPLIWGAARLPSMKNFFEDYKEASIFYSDLLWVTDIILDPNMYKNFMDGSLETIDSSFEIVKEFKAGKNTTFRHYRIGNFSLADVRIAKPKCTDSWKEYIYEWFESGSTQIMYDSCKEVEYSEDDAKNAAVKVKEYSNGRILLDINAPSPVPVLVKEAYDQDWKAYGSDGKELQIYKATPQLMMVFAKGQVLLKYSPKDRVALFALIPFALISIFIIKKKIGYAQ